MHSRKDRDPCSSGCGRTRHAEAVVVVPVLGVVPVAVGRAEVLWIIVPGTAAQNATGSCSGWGG